jgi:hypothetical protein
MTGKTREERIAEDKKRFIVGLDFDGTVLTHAYPDLGDDISAFYWLREAQKMGAEFILFTMRDGHELRLAFECCASRGIDLFGVNENPEQHTWTISPKPYCHLYIDDMALGCPLEYPERGGRPYVDWAIAGPLLLDMCEERLGGN